MRRRHITNSLGAIVSVGGACGAAMAIPGLLTVHIIMWVTDPIDRCVLQNTHSGHQICRYPYRAVPGSKQVSNSRCING